MLDFRPSGRSSSAFEMPDMTPMIDCVFQLLIFFLLASSFVKGSSVILDLPKSNATTAPTDEPIVVSMNKQGMTFLNDQPISTEQLTDSVRTAMRNATSTAVLFRADKTLAYESVLGVIVRLEQAGAGQVKLSYEHE
ncbi:MAG: biopolymer transporter ExbD [Planctomycetota bacterium]